MKLSRAISPEAIRLNPLVSAWDDSLRPLEVEYDDGTIVKCGKEIPEPALSAAVEFSMAAQNVPCPGGVIDCSRTIVMGILNVTPDSFSDGGKWLDTNRAIERGIQMIAEGADIIDVGGESTRPGAEPVDANEEIRRVIPVIEGIARQTDILISTDTSKAAVAEAAIHAGASIINDVTALRDPQMAALAAKTGSALILMHMQGEPRTMQAAPQYYNVVRDVARELRAVMARAVAAGVDPERLIIDPGIGFGKTVDHNLTLLARLPVLSSLGRPILIGCSRKSFIGQALGLPVGTRLNATISANVLSIANRASIIRVHDVKEAVESARMADALLSHRK